MQLGFYSMLPVRDFIVVCRKLDYNCENYVNVRRTEVVVVPSMERSLVLVLVTNALVGHAARTTI